MSITDNLREWASVEVPYKYGHQLIAIADQIDTAHKHAIGYVDDRDPETMAENGWVRLPKDADGVPIHVGDMLTDDAEFKSEGKVMRLMLEDEGWMVGIGCAGWTEPSIHEWHHYHAPTVENVLCQLLNEYREGGCTLEEARLSDFAAKLQLREDA